MQPEQQRTTTQLYKIDFKQQQFYMFTRNKKIKIQNVNNLATENKIQKNRRTTKKNDRIKQKKKK